MVKPGISRSIFQDLSEKVPCISGKIDRRAYLLYFPVIDTNVSHTFGPNISVDEATWKYISALQPHVKSDKSVDTAKNACLMLVDLHSTISPTTITHRIHGPLVHLRTFIL